MRAYFLLATLLAFCVPSLAAAKTAADNGFDSTHGAWNVFSSGKGADKVCYVTAIPTKEAGTFKQRGNPYVLVTTHKGGAVEVSVSSGYPYKEGSKTELVIGNVGKFQLFTTGETPKIAWANSTEDDKKIAAALKKGKKMTVTGSSQKNSVSTDTYTLTGFGAAYKRMTELCK